MAETPLSFPSWRTLLPAFLTLRDEFALDKWPPGREALRHNSTPPRRRMHPQERGLAKSVWKQAGLKRGPSDSIYQWWRWCLLKWLPSASLGPQTATSIGRIATHSLHEAVRRGGTPQLEPGLADTRLAGEEDRETR